jgi:hypothetical protein
MKGYLLGFKAHWATTNLKLIFLATSMDVPFITEVPVMVSMLTKASI